MISGFNKIIINLTAMNVCDEVLNYRNLIAKVNKLCYPITLSPLMMSHIEDREYDTLSLLANDMVICRVNFRKYPLCVKDNLFFPFYTDKYFNIYELETYNNDIALEISSSTSKYSYIIKKTPRNSCKSKMVDFILKFHEDNDAKKYTVLRFSCGALGFPIFNPWRITSGSPF